MMRELGGVFGIAILVAVFAGRATTPRPKRSPTAFAPAIAVSAGLPLAGAVAGTALPGRRGSPDDRGHRPDPALEAECPP
jgi:hypothetical protein